MMYITSINYRSQAIILALLVIKKVQKSQPGHQFALSNDHLETSKYMKVICRSIMMMIRLPAPFLIFAIAK